VAAALAALRHRARLGLNEARKRRKYCPPGPYTPVELAAMRALIEVEQQAATLLDGKPAPLA